MVDLEHLDKVMQVLQQQVIMEEIIMEVVEVVLVK
jgi:hypothetical protein